MLGVPNLQTGVCESHREVQSKTEGHVPPHLHFLSRELITPWNKFIWFTSDHHYPLLLHSTTTTPMLLWALLAPTSLHDLLVCTEVSCKDKIPGPQIRGTSHFCALTLKLPDSHTAALPRSQAFRIVSTLCMHWYAEIPHCAAPTQVSASELQPLKHSSFNQQNRKVIYSSYGDEEINYTSTTQMMAPFVQQVCAIQCIVWVFPKGEGSFISICFFN